MTLSNECSRVKRSVLGRVHFTSIALAAGFIPAATLSLMSPALLRVTY